MSQDKISVEIQICSNCKSHQWCTRHNESSYSSLALELEKAVKVLDDSIRVQIFQVGGSKMGSFEVICNGTLIFSKLNLGYFPHVPSVITRLASFIDDYKHGRDLRKYAENKGFSPHHTLNKSGGKSFGVNSPTKPVQRSQSPVKRTKLNPDTYPINKQPNNNKHQPHVQSPTRPKNKDAQPKQSDKQKNKGSQVKQQHVPQKSKQEAVHAQKQPQSPKNNPKSQKKVITEQKASTIKQKTEKDIPQQDHQAVNQPKKKTTEQEVRKKTEANNEAEPSIHTEVKQKTEHSQPPKFIMEQNQGESAVKPTEKAQESPIKSEKAQPQTPSKEPQPKVNEESQPVPAAKQNQQNHQSTPQVKSQDPAPESA